MFVGKKYMYYLCRRKQQTKLVTTLKYKIMKRQTNISVLKELVNNNVMERAELRTRGVQAYNIAEGEEFSVLVAYTKQGGRYYFVARDGRRFLASRYDRAEFVAGEMLEVIANDNAAAMHAADQVEASGSVLVCADLLPLFFEECDRRNIHVTSTAAGVDDLGRMLTRYNLLQDAEPAQQSDNNDTQSDDNNEGNQTPAEPSRLAQAAAKIAASVKAYAVNGAKRFAFLLSMLAVLVLTLVVAFGPVVIMGTLFDALGITGAARPLLAMLILLWPSLELAINVECNAVALVSRLFPNYLRHNTPFGCFSFWGRMLRA